MRCLIFIVFFSLQALYLSSQCDRQTVVNDYNNIFLATDFDVAELAWSGSTTTCNPGTISSAVQQKVLDRINYFRKLCDLNDDVVFSSSLNQKCQEAAVMQEANGSISHCTGTNGAPCDTWLCSTSDAMQASASSNLAWGNWNSFEPVKMYVEDAGSSNIHVGHRRWILYSRAKTFGNGLTPSRNVMWVFGNNGNPAGNNRDYIAYPPGDYIIQDLVYPRWSFGIPGGDFTNASVSMTAPNGSTVSTNIIYNASVGFGDYSLVWEPTGVNVTSSFDETYTVTISNIGGASPQSSYTYNVTIVPNVFPPNCPTGQTWDNATCQCQAASTCPDSIHVASVISSGTYEADRVIMSDGSLNNTASVFFESGDHILLNNNFDVPAGANFYADIIYQPCINFTDPNPIETIFKTQIEGNHTYSILISPPLESN